MKITQGSKKSAVLGKLEMVNDGIGFSKSWGINEKKSLSREYLMHASQLLDALPDYLTGDYNQRIEEIPSELLLASTWNNENNDLSISAVKTIISYRTDENGFFIPPYNFYEMSIHFDNADNALKAFLSHVMLFEIDKNYIKTSKKPFYLSSEYIEKHFENIYSAVYQLVTEYVSKNKE